MTKTRTKRPIAKSRTIEPEIYVRVSDRDSWRVAYAKAKIRVRAGEYQYLQWRDAGRVRSLYLGRKRTS
jgi:hypothetical protein